jgi:hypothetical protein
LTMQHLRYRALDDLLELLAIRHALKTVWNVTTGCRPKTPS